MPGPIIWGPNNTALNLEGGIQFGAPANSPSALSGSVDPTSSAVAAGKGSIYLSTSTGIAYMKQDNGSSTNWTPLGAASSYDPTKNVLFLADDFLGSSRDGGTSQFFGQFGWASSSLDAGGFSIIGSTITSSVNHPGVIQFQSATNANDGASIFTGSVSAGASNLAFFPGSGAIRMRCLCYVSQLSNGTNNTMLSYGLSDSPAWNGESNCIRIQYEYEVDQLHWHLHTTKAGTATNTISTIVTTTGWHWLQIDVNAAGTSVSYTIDGVLAGTSSTNIPVVGLPYRFDLRKTLGTTPSSLGLDYIDLTMALSR